MLARRQKDACHVMAGLFECAALCLAVFPQTLNIHFMAVIVNLEETIGKTVGNRKLPDDGLALVIQTAEEARRWKKAFGAPRIPKGAYRFKTHEEADRWLWSMITRPRQD